MSVEQNLETPSTGGGRFQFPTALGVETPQWMLFTRYKYSRETARHPAKNMKVGNVIVLPAPPDLKATYGAQWENTELGMFGRHLSELAGGIINEIKSGKSYTDAIISGTGTGKVIDAIKAKSLDAFGSSAGELLDKLGPVANDYFFDVTSGTTWWKQGAAYHGLARNPFHAVLYTGPNFRNYNFSYKLIPSNQQEADTIRNIIKEFKIGMSPSYSAVFENNLFEYPDVFEIQMAESEYTFKIAMCALKSLDVNYHGEGSPKYIQGKIPFSITIDLEFQELEVLVREDIVNKGEHGGY